MSKSFRAKLEQAAQEAGFLSRSTSPMRDSDGPPVGWVGRDRDGAMVYFGSDPCWIPAYEGQRPTELPPAGRYVHADLNACPTCGTVYGLDTRRSAAQTCAGCLRAGDRQEYEIMAEKVRDEARKLDKEKRRESEQAALNYAQKKFGNES